MVDKANNTKMTAMKQEKLIDKGDRSMAGGIARGSSNLKAQHEQIYDDGAIMLLCPALCLMNLLASAYGADVGHSG